MPIKVSCDDCFTDLKVADQHAGKKIKCKECGKVLKIPVPQRGVRPAESRQNKLEDAWDESELEAADDDADELPATPVAPSHPVRKRRRKGRATTGMTGRTCSTIHSRWRSESN